MSEAFENFSMNQDLSRVSHCKIMAKLTDDPQTNLE